MSISATSRSWSARSASSFSPSVARALREAAEFGGGGLDRGLHVGQFAQVAAQAVDLLDLRALEVAVVGEHARDRGDVVLLQQQLEFLVVAQRVGRAQQGGERLALRLQRLFQIGAPPVELRQLALLRGDATVQGVHVLRHRGHGQFLLAQRAHRLVALAGGRALLLGQGADLGAHGVELLLGVALLHGAFLRGALRLVRFLRLRLRRNRREQRQREPKATHQEANSTRLRPLISAGCGRPISASTVGARSRSAPRCSVARRPT